MKKIEAYKSESGVIYENIDDAIRADDALEALSFYADPESYMRSKPHQPTSPIHVDRGEKARAVLAAIRIVNAVSDCKDEAALQLLTEHELEAIYNNGK